MSTKIVKLSSSEIKYVVDGISQDIRADGRGCLDFRPFSFETGSLAQTNGSCRLILDTTDVLVGVKAELGDPDPQFPNQGRVHVSVECAPSASPEFEGRGGEELNLELSNIVERLLQSSAAFKSDKLCLVPGKQVWIIYVDAMVLDSGGNLVDAIALAARAALFSTKIPSVKVKENIRTGQVELEVSDDPEDCIELDIEEIPITVTLTKVGHKHIVDATLEEEFCPGCRLIVGINKKGNSCAIQMGNGAIDSTSFIEILKAAHFVGTSLLQKMDEVLHKERKMGILGVNKLGFFA
eukprot:TRINITY_DN8823_c0_g1_i1.p1 TRINITY_DN8823_c0_g1~~TRINITY_DN8823_c0_g1_i1.p1  ORF type:complete len:295 (+),score=59.47 TRINITY_DN8823_c0_g1_i1:74-958(+)